MTRHAYVACFLVLVLAGLTGCSSQPPAKQAAAPDKIQGKAQVLLTETTQLDASMNGGWTFRLPCGWLESLPPLLRQGLSG